MLSLCTIPTNPTTTKTSKTGTLATLIHVSFESALNQFLAKCLSCLTYYVLNDIILYFCEITKNCYYIVYMCICALLNATHEWLTFLFCWRYNYFVENQNIKESACIIFAHHKPGGNEREKSVLCKYLYRLCSL